MHKTLKQRIILLIIRVNRRMFYNTPVHRNKYVNKLYRKIFTSAYNPGQEFIVEYEENKYHFPSDDITILPSLLNNGYEKNEIRVFKEKIKPGMTVVDIGANIGIYSVIASKTMGGSGLVYSFEPEPTNYKFLQKNILLNKCENINAQKIAMGEKKGTSYLFKEDGSIGTHSLVKKNASDDQNKIQVEVTTLDKYFKKDQVVDIIKLDVEGHELAVLSGSKRVLKNVTHLFFEYNQLTKASEIIQFENLLSGFKNFYIIDDKVSKVTMAPLETIVKLKYANILASNV